MDLHQMIMNIPDSNEPVGGSLAYKLGHRDARHAAAKLASADEAARVAPLRARVEWLENALQHIAATCEGRPAEVAASALAGRVLMAG